MIKGSPWTKRDLDLIFYDELIHFSNASTLHNLMVEVGAYNSASEARRAGRQGAIPSGYTEMKASKKRRLYIWNPSE